MNDYSLDDTTWCEQCQCWITLGEEKYKDGKRLCADCYDKE